MLKKTDIQKALDILWASTIDELNFDLNEKRISFTLSAINNDVREYHSLVFERVVTFSYAPEDGGIHRVTEEGKWPYLELSELYYDNQNSDVVKQNEIKNKFYLLIWHSTLLIRANRIIIDNKAFDLVASSVSSH